MQEKIVEAGTTIIRQGDDGDVLYVVEEGSLECSKNIDGTEKVLKVVGPGDAFGELALLYSCPRAASVKAAEKCLLWELDRETFNHIVKDASAKKREKYEAFLKSVPLLEGMEPYERSKVADALRQETFEAGATIVNQGDPGDKFFIIEEGESIATKSFVPGQIPQEVMHYKMGDYFGELALLHNEPRAANVVAKSAVRVLYLDRRSFKRLLGPLEDILRRNTTRYA
jgi:cAMP-dependent protein kinase regulator